MAGTRIRLIPFAALFCSIATVISCYVWAASLNQVEWYARPFATNELTDCRSLQVAPHGTLDQILHVYIANNSPISKVSSTGNEHPVSSYDQYTWPFALSLLTLQPASVFSWGLSICGTYCHSTLTQACPN